MTVGTGIVVGIGIICVTLIALALIGSRTTKNNTTNKIAEEIFKNINKKM